MHETPADYAFAGFSPTGENITGDTDCYAAWTFVGMMYKKLLERTITNIESEVTTVGKCAFYLCGNLVVADLPEVTSIDDSAFRECALTTLILRSETVASLGKTSAFNSTPIASGTGYIYVPAALVDSYKTATNWSTYANQFRAIEDYPEITGGES